MKSGTSNKLGAGWQPWKQLICLVFALLGFDALSADATSNQPNKADSQVKLSNLADFDLESLLNMEVTSVARKEQKVSESAAAIYVIGQEELRRSGATSIRGAPVSPRA